MKKSFILLLGMYSMVCFGQKKQPVALKWKIDKDKPVHYAIAMEQVNVNNADISDEMLKKLFPDTTMSDGKKSIMRQLNTTAPPTSYLITLTNKEKDIVDIIMALPPKDTPDNEAASEDSAAALANLIRQVQELNQGVVLRGAVFANGGIQSFWVKSNQKNLVAQLFELPDHPVKVGEKWKIDINLIGNDQNFVCDSAYKINEVKLENIQTINGETIAEIRYNIVEYVKGTFNMSLMNDLTNSQGNDKLVMQFTNTFVGKWSVNKGRWNSLEGIMDLHGEGPMVNSAKTKITMTLEK